MAIATISMLTATQIWVESGASGWRYAQLICMYIRG